MNEVRQVPGTTESGQRTVRECCSDVRRDRPSAGSGFVEASIAVVVLAMASTAYAGPDDGVGKKLLSMGCHVDMATCFVYVDGNAIGPTGCKSTSLRWEPKAAPGGQEALSLLTSAYLAGKKVDFGIAAACFSVQPSFPTISYFVVHD